MEYTTLGQTGLFVSRICLGMMSYGDPDWRDWILDYEKGLPIVQRAVELGITFFDTANMYSVGVSESHTGRYLKEFFTNRDQYVLATKVCLPMGDFPTQRGLSRKHIFDSLDASLKRLNTDYIDLYQIHRLDPHTSIHEMMDALNDVVKSGKVRYIGASSMFAWQFIKAQYTADLKGWTRFVSMQNHYNLLYREEEREMNPYCLEEGVGLIPWSPLARGFLAGSRSRGGGGETTRSNSDDMAARFYYSDEDWAILDRVKELADRYETSPAQISLAWLLHKPAVSSPIIGATKMKHVEEAVASLGIKLSHEDVTYLEELYTPRIIKGHL
ncbi:aldo/keto reductase [Anaerolineales bacterium]